MKTRPAEKISSSLPAVHWRSWEPSLTKEQEVRVRDIWKKKTGPGLFDGPFFTMLECTSSRILGAFVSYRYLVASREDASLGLALSPVGVTGLVVRKGRRGKEIAVGLRGSNSALYPNHWEVLPAGGLDERAKGEAGAMNPEVVLRAELQEEIGLDDSHLGEAEIQPLGFVHDTVHSIYDLCWAVRLPDRGVSEARLKGEGEHKSIRWMGLSEFKDSLNQSEECWVPTAGPLLEMEELI